MSDENGIKLPQTGIIGYDLGPPSPSPPSFAYSSFRDRIGNPQPRPRWGPPQLPEGHVRVELDDDYYAGAYFRDWNRSETGSPGHVFDLPQEQYDRWVAARDAYYAMQEEIEAVQEEHRVRRDSGWPEREGWVRKDRPYQVQP